MSTDAAPAVAARRGWRLAAACCEIGAAAAWVLLVLRYQYGVAWLQSCDEADLDALFLGAAAGTLVARAVARRSAAAGRVLLLRLVALLVATAVAVVGAEYAARIVFRSARSSGNVRDYVGRGRAWSPGPPNSLGFRERNIPPKTAGRYRIAVVGDSFTWGQGIERSERFSDLLDELLGPRYEVLNFGLPGDNMPEHLEVLERALGVAPDFVLLQLYINDFETREMQRPRAYPLLPSGLDRRLQQASLLYDLLSGQWTHVQNLAGISESYIDYMDRNLRDPTGPNSQKAFGELKQFFERARQAGVAAGAVLFPETDVRADSTYPFRYLHARVQSACSDERVRCLDLLPLFSTFRDPSATWVSPFDAHPNALVNRKAAYEILAAFGSAWQH